MRTTLSLRDDAFQAASNYAAARSMKLGDAVSELVQRGLERATSAVRSTTSNGIAVFDIPSQSPKKTVTAELVKQLMED